MTPTQRTFTDVETGHTVRLYTSHDASQWHLINEQTGQEIKPYYLTTIGGEIRLNTGRTITVPCNQFYHLKDGEMVTHTKIEGQKKFRKI